MSGLREKCPKHVQFGWEAAPCGGPTTRFFVTVDRSGAPAFPRSPVRGMESGVLIVSRCQRCFSEDEALNSMVRDSQIREVTREEAVVLEVLCT